MQTKPLDLDQFDGHTPEKMVAAIRLAIADHKAQPLVDWPFIDSLNAAVEAVYGHAALLTECRRLRAENEKLRELLSSHVGVFALQALRDSADPDCLDGWRKLQDNARAALGAA